MTALAITHSAAALLAALLTWQATSGWYGARMAKESAAQAQAAQAAAEQARSAQEQLTQQLEAARHASIEREARLRRDAASSRDALYGLRDAAREQRQRLPGYSHAAAIGAADTAAELLTDCARTATELAAAADGHASDAMSLQQAWPRLEATP